MKTIFHLETREELVGRINSMNQNNKRKWGKMTPYQMLKHCTLSEELFLGETHYKRLFIGRLFGSMSLKNILKNDAPMKQNEPTHPQLKITGTGDFEAERSKWIELLNKYSYFSNDTFVHPFFGSMTKEEIGNYVYKHTDHHLRQFGS
ncbi:DUF1569 domain-containing protein [Fluviicola sp.]|uniref:DUF1569 domain-containing protein n=1 Tax=Fluviicola sp. TaxID=1917219 RepID=UPI00262F9DDB|nr:DUF1569 domain-containing protein [Fluviicola sp.]